MAKVLGQSGRYVTNEVSRKRRQFLLVIFIVLCLLSAFEGFLLSLYFHPASFSQTLKGILAAVVALSVLLVGRVANRKLKELEKSEGNYQRGADGENVVARTLDKFPDDFAVVHDLTTPFGNLDHVVIGPTGVFMLDTKNWRGVVSADGKGELLVNGSPTDKAHARPLMSRMLKVRDKVRTLAPGPDPFYHGLLVFTAARVEAKWGSTKNINCIRDDQLYSYIVEKDFGKRLRPDEVQQIAQAFLGLAHMDREFAQPDSKPQPTH